MRHAPASLVTVSAIALCVLLGACTAGDPLPTPADSASTAPQPTEEIDVVTGGASWTPDPACADFVAQRSAAMEEAYDQHAEMAGVDDLPFALATDDYGWMGDEVACVWTVFRGDDSEPSALEVLVYAPEGDASYVFASSPDLTARECPTDGAVSCFEGTDVVVVVTQAGSVSGTEGFQAVVQGAGIQ